MRREGPTVRYRTDSSLRVVYDKEPCAPLWSANRQVGRSAEETMANSLANAPGNRVLTCLVPADYALLEHNLKPAVLKFRQCLEVANRRIKLVYFPYRGIVSVVAVSKNRDHQSEVGLVGHEGMTGLPILLGSEQSPVEVYVQVEGDGVSIGASKLRQAMDKSASLRT